MELAWIVLAVVTAIIAKSKGGSGLGYFFLGLVSGPIGFVMSLLMPGSLCPHCWSRVHPNATVCPKCTRDMHRFEVPTHN